MALPSTEELKGVIVDILTRARDEGRLDQLTVRIVLRELATHYGLEQDVFQTPTYKPFIKDTVFATVNRFENASDGDAEPPRRKATKEKKKSDGSTKTGKRKRPSTARIHSSDEEPPEEANASESEAPPPKKASAHSKPSKQVKSSKTPKKSESEMKFKSKAVIESSDEEAAPEFATQKPARSPKKEKMAAKSSPPKLKQQQEVNKGDSDAGIASSANPGPSSSSSKPKPATESPKHSVSKPEESTRDPMESELSSVIDEPQTKRQKKQKKESAKPQKEEKIKRGKKKEALSKDEETVNKLKGVVVACGVRKVWKKEFEGLDKPSQQIKRLHLILDDLGMTPRYSMEKARAIRERRELAQELKEVQEFDKAIKRRQQGPRSPPETEESMDQDDSDADMPARKKQNARTSIMAFLQDQSEEE